MQAVRLSCAALTALVLVRPAYSQSAVVHIFKFAHDDADPSATMRGAAASPRPRDVPRGLPGFYDTKSGTFTPASLGPPPAVLIYSGTYTFNIGVEPGNGIAKGDTVFCTATLSFGNDAGTPPTFFTNHTADGATNFGVGDTGTISFPFKYIPTAYNSKFTIDVTCQIPYASDGSSHTATFDSAESPVKDGNVLYPIIAQE